MLNTSPIATFGNSSTSLDVGGVLIDKAATLINSNLGSIKGATFDPVSKQIIFLGSGTSNATSAINMDYFYTAVQAVYGSAVPPFVTLDPPASPASAWVDLGNGDGTLQRGEEGGFVLRYNPLWSGEDIITTGTQASVDVNFILSQTVSPYTQYNFTLHFAATSSNTPAPVGGRHAMILSYVGSTGTLPSGLTLDTSYFQNPQITLTANSQDSYWSIVLNNNTNTDFAISSFNVIPAKQHREYGGRVDGTRLGWVMYEADRVMKCLSVGKDNLTGAQYNSSTVLNTNGQSFGFQNLLERQAASGLNGSFNARMWFVPNDMTLQRSIDPTTGQATIVFQQSTVSLLTESYLQGQASGPIPAAFAAHFNSNYDAFAAQSFPVQDPTDGHTISVPIFALLRQAMQAVTLARFFRDNNIPLDKWWMNTWQPPTAYSLKSIPTAYNSNSSTGYMIVGGVQIYKTNNYVPSATAQSIGQAITGARTSGTDPAQDLKQQAWSASTVSGSMNAVAASLATDYQDGNVKLAKTDLSFASPGELPLAFTRYYQSSWLGTGNMGPGWRSTRYVLQFSNPSWYDQTQIMKDGSGNQIATDSNSDTRLRSGTVRLVDLSTGAQLDFQSSLSLNYATDSLGNPSITITGLTNGVPTTFAPGQFQSGATLAQTADANKLYVVTMPEGSVLQFDSNGNLLQTTDRHSYSQWYAYDTSGRLSTITDSAAQVITLAYSATNSMLQTASGPATTGTNIQSVTYNYDTSGRLWTVVHTQSGAQIAQYSYNTSNQLVDVTRMDGLKPVTTTADAKGRSSVRKNARGNSNTWSFYKNSTDRSRVTSAFDASSGLSAWEQGADSSGRQTYIKDPLNNYTLYGYTGSSLLPTSVQLPTVGRPAITIARNSFGLPTTITDPAIPGAQPTQIKYTGANLPWQVTDAAGRATEVDYTTSNNVKKLRQYHNGQAVETTCDYLNEYLHTVTDPLSHTWTYGRDSVGRVTSASDPTGVTISCDYDALGRLWHIYDPKLSSPVVYGYDSLNRVQTITTPTGTTSYVYDPITKWLQSTTVATTDGKTRTLVYGYNSQTGDVTSTTYQYPATTGGTTSITTNYGYTDYGALNSVTPPGAEPINFNVNALGQTLGTSESNAGLTVGPSITANNATSSAWTNQSSQIFVWGAPPSSLPITGYNYAEDTATSLTVNTTGLTAAWNSVADGQHAFRVRGQDSGGNWSPESVFNLWVDTTPPAITGVSNTPSPIPKSTTSAVATANISDALSGLGSNIPQLRWCISADATRNWNAYTNMTQGTGNQWSSSISVNWSQYAGQTLYYQIQAQDAAGNISTITNSDSINASTGVLAMSLWMRISLVSLLFVAIARLLPRKPVSIG